MCLILVAVVILVGVFIVAIGRGGEMAEYADYPPLDLGLMTAADVALLRPPSALWGYNMQVTDEALDRIAQVVAERDVEIAALRSNSPTCSAPAGPLTRIRLTTASARTPRPLPPRPLTTAPLGRPADDSRSPARSRARRRRRARPRAPDRRSGAVPARTAGCGARGA